MTESKVQSRGDNGGILFRSTLLRQIISNVNTDVPSVFAFEEKMKKHNTYSNRRSASY